LRRVFLLKCHRTAPKISMTCELFLRRNLQNRRPWSIPDIQPAPATPLQLLPARTRRRRAGPGSQLQFAHGTGILQHKDPPLVLDDRMRVQRPEGVLALDTLHDVFMGVAPGVVLPASVAIHTFLAALADQLLKDGGDGSFFVHTVYIHSIPGQKSRGIYVRTIQPGRLT